MEGSNNLGEKNFGSFSMFFLHGCCFSGEQFNSCNFFHGRLRAYYIFRRVKLYWMVFIIPITDCHVFSRTKLYISLLH